MTKIIKNSIITVLFTLIVLTVFPTTVFAKEYEPRLTAPQGEPYYTSELNTYSQTGYGMPNCVAYAYGRVYEMNGVAPKINRGDAGEWWFINKSNNYYDYGNEPKLGAVACWSGHVAVVESISDDGVVTISESHWGGTYFDTIEYENVYDHFGQAFYGYIYTFDDSKTEEEIQEMLDNSIVLNDKKSELENQKPSFNEIVQTSFTNNENDKPLMMLS